MLSLRYDQYIKDYKEKKNKNGNNNSDTNYKKEDAIMQDSSLESSSANQNNLE